MSRARPAARRSSRSSRAPRCFYRSDAFNEKLIAANVTQVIGVVAPDIAVDEELVNRWIIAAEAQSCRFVLVANKSDQPGFATFLARLQPFAALGYAVVPMSARTRRRAAPPAARVASAPC